MDAPKKVKVIRRSEVQPDLLEDLRKLLATHLQPGADGGGAISDHDLVPIREDFHLERILRRTKDVKEALRVIIEVVNWRKNFNPGGINPFVTCEEAFHQGVMYFHGKSRGGALILVIRGSLIRKPKDLAEENACRQYFIYFIEYAAVNLHSNITVLVDCRKTKLDNLHMVYLKTMIDAFKTYYMDALDYVLVFDLPVVLNACWKTIRKMIPSEGVDRTKMVNKKSILKYISQHNLPRSFGGSSPYAYSFDHQTAIPPGVLQDLAEPASQRD